MNLWEFHLQEWLSWLLIEILPNIMTIAVPIHYVMKLIVAERASEDSPIELPLQRAIKD